MALKAGFDPGRIHLHGNAKSWRELEEAHDAGVGHVVLDNIRDIERLEEIVAPGERQPVQMRIAPGRQPRHAPVDLDRRPEHEVRLQPRRGGRPRSSASTASDKLDLEGLHIHIGSQIVDLAPFRPAIAALADLGDFRMFNLGGGLGVAYTEFDHPPSIEDYVAFKVDAVEQIAGPGKRILDEPGRALVANSTVTLYTVESVKRNVMTYVAVDGGMSDNLRPMLYGARYEAQVVGARRAAAPAATSSASTASPATCSIHDADLADPRAGDVDRHAGDRRLRLLDGEHVQRRSRARPVVFVSDGDARVVVRRETYEDLTVRDV